MRVGIDIAPLFNANSVRGVGFYTKNLIAGLQNLGDGNEYVLVEKQGDLRNSAFDVIHYPYFDLFFATLPERSHTPVVVTVHDVIPLMFPQHFPAGLRGRWRMRGQKARLQKVDRVVTDSIASKREIVDRLGIDEDRVEVVYLSISNEYAPVTDTSRLEAVRTKYSLPEKFVIKVGDINKHKNFAVTLDAFSRMPDVHLVLVGKSLTADLRGEPIIPELAEILELIKAYSLQNRVHRLGFVSDDELATLYTLASSCLMNSWAEGFGIPALEALACGTPVVGSNCSSIPEIVGNAGILVDPWDVTETVDAIRKIAVLSGDDRQILQKKCLQQASYFSLEKTARHTAEVYRQAYDKHV